MSFLESAWYKRSGWLLVLWPVSLLFRLLASLRRKLQQPGQEIKGRRVTVVVVGNLTVGGTGKTPLLMELARLLQANDFTPGIISRGYSGEGASYPLLVEADTKVAQAGDEAVMLADKTGCPVVIDPDRVAALEYLTKSTDVDVVLSDDGLQHYRLARDIEICVIDGQRLFGNGMCLPAGPLREPVSRLQEVDFTIVNGAGESSPDIPGETATMELVPKYLINLATGEKRPFGGAPFNIGNVLQVVAAIGNPQRFFDLLEKLPYQMQTYIFPDHHLFTEEDFESRNIDERQPVVMTEKDAVKCRAFARNNFWYLSTELVLPESFRNDFVAKVQTLTEQR